MTEAVRRASLDKRESEWFVRWVQWYADFCGCAADEAIPIDRQWVIAFLRKQKDAGREAWQRLQVVCAIEFYGDRVLGVPVAELEEIRIKLDELARNETKHPSLQQISSSAETELTGRLDHTEPRRPNDRQSQQRLEFKLQLALSAFNDRQRLNSSSLMNAFLHQFGLF